MRSFLEWLDQRSSRGADRIVDLAEQTGAFLRRRAVETAVVAIGLVLRFSMLAYHPHNAYDSYEHLAYIQWFATHVSLPDLMLSRETYHPPLYYLIAGAFSRLVHGKAALLGLPSMTFSSVTLLLTWFGLERYLPGRRLARIAALALAATLPAAVHLAGMPSGEGLNGLLATAALLLTADTVSRQQRGQPIAGRALVVGAVAGLQMLTKISGLATLAAIGAGAAAAVAIGARGAGPLVRRAAPWLMVVFGFLAVSGWLLARNQIVHGKAVLSGFDGIDGRTTPKLDTPYLQRRSPDFFYGWTNDVLRHPYAPNGTAPKAYFWPVLIASTFVDYYNHSFVRNSSTYVDHWVPGESLTAEDRAVTGNNYPLRRSAVGVSRASAAGGTIVAVSIVIAWFWALVVCLRRRQVACLVFLFAPAIAVLGQLHFVVLYPFDYQGPIKGVYLQFAAAPLAALFGLAVDEMCRRRATWPIAIVQCAALLAVASYTIFARAVAF